MNVVRLNECGMTLKNSLSVSRKEYYDYIYKEGFTNYGSRVSFIWKMYSQKEIVYF
jgi:hypothetical protein